MSTPANELIVHLSHLSRGAHSIPHTEIAKVITALESVEALEAENKALRAMRDENVRQINALENDIAQLRMDLHSAYDLLENR
jgi:cell division protein FtsB